MSIEPAADDHLQSGMTEPDASPGHVAERVARAMVASEPATALGWGTARDDQGKPLYLCAVVMGSENVKRFERLLTELKPHTHPVDIFDSPPPDPPDPPG